MAISSAVQNWGAATNRSTKGGHSLLADHSQLRDSLFQALLTTPADDFQSAQPSGAEKNEPPPDATVPDESASAHSSDEESDEMESRDEPTEVTSAWSQGNLLPSEACFAPKAEPKIDDASGTELADVPSGSLEAQGEVQPLSSVEDFAKGVEGLEQSAETEADAVEPTALDSSSILNSSTSPTAVPADSSKGISETNQKKVESTSGQSAAAIVPVDASVHADKKIDGGSLAGRGSNSNALGAQAVRVDGDKKPTGQDGAESKNRRALRLEENRDGRSEDRDEVERTTHASVIDKVRPENFDSTLNAVPQETNIVQPATPSTALSSPSSDVVASVLASSAALAGRMGETSAGVAKPSTPDALTGVTPGSAAATNASRSRTTATPAPSLASLTPRQEVRLVQRVLRGFEQLATGEGQVKLRLHPPQLGSLQMQLRMDGSQLTARLEVQDAMAREAILENLPKLKDRLVEQGIQIEAFEVQVQSLETNAWQETTSNEQGGNPAQHGFGEGQSQAEPRRSAGQWRGQLHREGQDHPVNETVMGRTTSSRKSDLDLTA